MAVDLQGNPVMTGWLTGNANFGGGNLNGNNVDILVVKLDKSGKEAPDPWSYLRVPRAFLPDAIREHSGFLSRIAPWAFGDGGDVRIGPIPYGTPVNLLANLEPLSESMATDARIAHW